MSKDSEQKVVLRPNGWFLLNQISIFHNFRRMHRRCYSALRIVAADRLLVR